MVVLAALIALFVVTNHTYMFWHDYCAAASNH
jgi:serine/threonine protein kinase